MTRYWLGVVSKEHVCRGIKDSFAQVCHGKKGPLSRMEAGDFLIYYSPKVSMDSSEKYQCFTAIGRIRNGTVYQVEMTADFHPFRIDVDYLPSNDVPVSDVSERLLVTKKNWGFQLRRGLLELNEADFSVIAVAMGVSV